MIKLNAMINDSIWNRNKPFFLTFLRGLDWGIIYYLFSFLPDSYYISNYFSHVIFESSPQGTCKQDHWFSINQSEYSFFDALIFLWHWNYNYAQRPVICTLIGWGKSSQITRSWSVFRDQCLVRSVRIAEAAYTENDYLNKSMESLHQTHQLKNYFYISLGLLVMFEIKFWVQLSIVNFFLVLFF